MAMSPTPDLPSPPGPTDPAAPSGRPGSADTLPCGRALEEVWDAWETDPSRAADDPHTATCPYCATALADLRTLDGLVRQEAARDAERSAASEAPETTGVTERVMTIVRTELRPGAAVPLGGEDEDTWIVETAVARTCRTAAEKVPGVRAGSCRVVPLDAPDRRFPLPGARLPRGPVRVRLGVTAPLNLRLPVPELADAVRRQVREAAESQLGLDVRAVDVRVLDLLEDPTEDD